MPLRGAEGKWILFAVDTGEQSEFWPIDGKALLSLGSHTAEPPAGVEPKIPKPPPRHAEVLATPVVRTFVGEEGETSAPDAAKSRKRAG